MKDQTTEHWTTRVAIIREWCMWIDELSLVLDREGETATWKAMDRRLEGLEREIDRLRREAQEGGEG